MALRTNEVLKLEDGSQVEIVGGPNDWDLWLCLRGTHRQVTFDTAQPIQYSFADATTFFYGPIMLIRNEKMHFYSALWYIEGKTGKGPKYEFTFSANYNTATRKGSATFHKVK